jgi:hypothetical protein
LGKYAESQWTPRVALGLSYALTPTVGPFSIFCKQLLTGRMLFYSHIINYSSVYFLAYLRRIFGPKRDEVMGEWRTLHNEELRDLYSLPSIIRIIKSSRMRWAGHVV